MAKSILIRVGIVLLGILVVVVGRGFYFYSGFYSAPPDEQPVYEDVVMPLAPSTEFNDVYEEGEGVILIDLAHDNAFDKEELNVLILRLVSRGLTIKFLTAQDNLKEELLGEDEDEDEEEIDQEEEPLAEENAEKVDQEEEISAEAEEEEELEEELPGAFIIVAPQDEFDKEEKEAVSKFVKNGGKLLLIADPTRRGEMNNLSIEFGLIFESDYLYNMKENETNYRNIFVAEFKENEITENLEKITLYTAGSISSANSSIAFVDENTFSNIIETRKNLSPIALTQESKVLAIYDLTFMTEPYNGVLDNNQLISNVADWLMSPAEGAELE